MYKSLKNKIIIFFKKAAIFLTEKKDTPERQTILLVCIGTVIFMFFASAISLDNKNKSVARLEAKILEDQKREKVHVNSHTTFVNPLHVKKVIIDEPEIKVLSVKTSHTISTGAKAKLENHIEAPDPSVQNLNPIKLVDTVKKPDSVMYKPRIVITKIP